jgi:hypothetical protein
MANTRHGHEELAVVEFGNMEKESNLLRKDKKKWKAEKKELKEEKKRLEYMYDPLKCKEQNMETMKKIMQICEE